MTQTRTPKELGYRFPAEWELQEAVWFAWPVRDDLWPECLEIVRRQLVDLYLLAAKYQKVRLLCPASHQEHFLSLVNEASDTVSIELFDYETDDVWIRDFGPLFLLHKDSSQLGIADWRYNAWGNKYPEQEKDDSATAWIAEQLGIRRFSFDAVLEGGAIESDGAGKILTTEAVLLNPNRNGELLRNEVSRELRSGLGADEVLWLKDGLVGDDTDGHVDNLARFFRSNGILIADTTDRGNPNFDNLQENKRRLREFRTMEGEPFVTVKLPLPEPVRHEGTRLAASYLNYLVLNGALLVPTYRQPERDGEAIEILQDCFPDREVVGFDCTDIIKEGGALHCMSQNQPALL
ncbi:MAG: agmatine deiminase family protein [Verrucomicrobiota bacterium]